MKAKKECRKIIERLNGYIDGELPVKERESVTTHIEYCLSCKNEYDKLIEINSLLSTVDSEECPSDIKHALKQLPNRQRSKISFFRPLSQLKPLPVAASILLTITAALFLGNNLTQEPVLPTSEVEQLYTQESLYTIWQEIYNED